MDDKTLELASKSLTAESTSLFPFLPYLLQDFWELGSSPGHMIGLLQKHVPGCGSLRVLDLACGKGAVSIHMAKRLGVAVKGIDLIPQFIEYAEGMARGWEVSSLCTFEIEDIGKAVLQEKDYDLVILGAVGNVLGSPSETMEKLKFTINKGGYILLDDAYLRTDTEEQVRYQNYNYPTKQEWEELFHNAGLLIVEALDCDETSPDDDRQTLIPIARRAAELTARHPDKKDLFEGYLKSQENELYDLAHTVVGVTWLLRWI